MKLCSVILTNQHCDPLPQTGYVFPHHRRQRNIESVIKALAPLSTTASALHEFIATNMSSTVDQGGSESETKDRAQPHVTFEATAEVVDSAA